MKLIIEAGGTKSNLVYTNNGTMLHSYTESGLNLSQETMEDFEKRMLKWSALSDTPVEEVYLFAAGTPGEQKKEQFLHLMATHFHTSAVSIRSDLLAACYATAGHSPGMVGILGTGSNTCFYDGKSIQKNVPPGGFILGDEGSGAYLGKKLLIDYLRGDVPADLAQRLHSEFRLDPADVIQNIYGSTVRNAAIYCSSFFPFIANTLQHEYSNRLCIRSSHEFLSFARHHYGQYSHQMYLVGSVAFYLSDILHAEAQTLNVKIIKITQHPIQDLCLFLAAS